MTDTTTVANASVTPLQQAISACSGALVTSLFVNPLDVVKVRLQTQAKLGYDKVSSVKNGGKRTCWMPRLIFFPVTPLDVVKVRLQAQQQPLTAGRCFIYCNGLMDHICTCEPLNLSAKNQMWYARPSHFTGTFDAFVKITRSEGIRSLWSGLPPTLVMAIPATAIYFTLYDNTMAYLRNNHDYKFWMPMLSGGCARTACVTIISPLEMIRTKLQSEKLAYKDILKVVRIASKEHGFRALWTGLGATLLRDVPFSCLYWISYETVKNQLKRHLQESNFSLSFVSGAIAGSIAAFITCPFDVVKTHRQIEIGESSPRNGYTNNTSTWILMEKLYQKDGLKGLFAGLTPRIIKVAPACAIMIGTYEYLKIRFKEHNNRRISLSDIA
uniref:Solute carrier family 25 member 40 n=1 Tax=Romanomermis culicivorax TaxID=13658 RepID=A0A915KRG8_ROMCU